MEEEADLDILLCGANFLPQHLWQEHKMVIMDPYQIAISYIFCHCLREKTVNVLVCSPCRLIERNFSGVVVEEGPEDGICRSCQYDRLSPYVARHTGKAIVMPVCKFIIDKDWDCAILVLQSLHHGSSFSIWHPQAGPAVPLEGSAL